MHIHIAVVLAVGLAVSSLGARQSGHERFWTHWRGPEATGVSRTADPPLEWSETKNVRWKTEIPGRGSATPIVWQDRIYLLTAVPIGLSGTLEHSPRGGATPLERHRFVVLAVDRRDGRILWQRVAHEGTPHEASHAENATWASSSAVTDGATLIAFFESNGLYAYDMNGGLLWKKDLGDKVMRSQFGEGSTPALHGNSVVVVWDHQGESFVVAFDKRSGKELWRVPRDEIDSWATPLIVEHAGRVQVVTSGMKRLRSYDLETGRIVWESEGVTMNPIPSPVAGGGMVFVTSGFRGNKLRAIRLADAKGDISNSPAMVWSLDRDTPYVPSPLLYDNILYLLKTNSGLLSAFEAATGKPLYERQRLPQIAEVFASPVGAQGRVYIVARDGTALVIRNGPTFEPLATNSLDDGFDASPAMADGDIYLRGYKYLYAIGKG
jgi:outer membrane protein assembly factor BamB